MNTTGQQQYVTSQDLREAKEEVGWKNFVILLALALQSQSTPAAPGESFRISLLGATPAFARHIRPWLEIYGFELVTCTSGTRLARVRGSSLFLVDERLPRHEELCFRLREISNAPVILLGANILGRSEDTAVDEPAGNSADACIKKSLSSDEFTSRIKTILGRV